MTSVVLREIGREKIRSKEGRTCKFFIVGGIEKTGIFKSGIAYLGYFRNDILRMQVVF